jgi:hypothetical protein
VLPLVTNQLLLARSQAAFACGRQTRLSKLPVTTSATTVGTVDSSSVQLWRDPLPCTAGLKKVVLVPSWVTSV